MLRKIIVIKNVGRFRNSAAPGNPQLATYTFSVGTSGNQRVRVERMLRRA